MRDGKTCVASPTNKKQEPILRTNPRMEALLPPFFLRTTFRNSATTPASPLIENPTTLRSSLWCSHCSVTKRQQFSCPLGTATLSLKLENVVPSCWICFFLYFGQVFFTAPPSMSSTRTYEKIQKISYDVTLFSSSTALKHCFFTTFLCF